MEWNVVVFLYVLIWGYMLVEIVFIVMKRRTTNKLFSQPSLMFM